MGRPDGTIRGAFAIKGTGRQDDSAYAVDTERAVRWRFETGADVDAPLSMLSDGSVVVASEDGTVTMLLP